MAGTGLGGDPLLVRLVLAVAIVPEGSPELLGIRLSTGTAAESCERPLPILRPEPAVEGAVPEGVEVAVPLVETEAVAAAVPFPLVAARR